MPRTRKVLVKPLPEDWSVTERFKWNGRHIERGTELKVRGIRGRVRFLKHVVTQTSEWVDVIDRDKHFRSVRPDAIKTVHRIKKTRENHVGK